MEQTSANLASGQPPKRKRLLLIDADAGKRALRAKIMGKAGLDVDGASDSSAARLLWRANSYHLVLIDLHDDAQGAAELCAEIKIDSPRQAVAFLVGKPAYLSSSPNPQPHSEPPAPSDPGETAAVLLTRHRSAPAARGGLLEATLRISSHRSRSELRQKEALALSFGEAVRRVQDEDKDQDKKEGVAS